MPKASATLEQETGPPMRVLRQYEVHCPSCFKGAGRTKIDTQGKSHGKLYQERMPCPTCRPEDYADYISQRDSEAECS